MSKKILFFLMLVSLQKAIGQNFIDHCGTDATHQRALQNPEYRQKHEAFENNILQRAQKLQKKSQTQAPQSIRTLPVVVHIIHENGAENISDALVFQGIQHLNEAFENLGYYDQGSGTNTMIQFCLAQRTPDGQATNGITRNQNALTNLNKDANDLALKNLVRWDPTAYVNIWLVKEICSSTGCGVAGYAYLPGAHGSNVDGIVMEAKWFGSDPGNSGVLVHEMGHYLGLLHTFQGGCKNDDCLTDGDRVCDTPPDNSTAWNPCPFVANTCSTDVQSGFATDQQDLTQNFMDYTPFSCFHDFTAGQSDRMNSTIETIRKSLLNSKACEVPCPIPVTAAFVPLADTVEVGQSISFMNSSSNAQSYVWKVNGTQFATTADAAYTFSSEGTYLITLYAISANPVLCYPDSLNAIIEVVCPVIANFEVDTNRVRAGEVVHFSNTSSQATIFDWSVNGISQGAVLNSYVFPEIGSYLIRLNASNGICEKSKFQYISVEDSCREYIFQITWGDDRDNSASHVAVLEDGNYLVVGRTEISSNNSQILISKVTPKGAILWSKILDASGLQNIHDLEPWPDGGWFLAGSTTSSGTTLDPWLARFDASGMLLWQKAIVSSTGDDYFTGLNRAKNGQILVVGALKTPNNQSWGAYLAKIDPATGLPVWAKLYDNTLTDFLHTVIETANGDLVCAGFTMSYGQNNSVIHDGMLLRTDASGNLLWTKAYGTPENEGFRQVIEESDGSLLAFGATSDWNGPGGGTYFDDGWFVKTTANGNLLNSKIYRTDQNIDYYPGGVERTPDGGLIWAANAGGTMGTNSAHYFKTDLDGNLEWSKIYGTAGEGCIFDVALIPNGYLFGGYLMENGSNEVALLKADPLGKAGLCDEIMHYMLVQTVQPTVVSGQLNSVTLPVLIPGNLTLADVVLPPTEKCPPGCIEIPEDPCLAFQNTYGTTANERGVVAVELNGGDLLVAGNITENNSSDIVISRLGADGTLIWSKRYGVPSVNELVYDLQPKPDGSFFFSFTIGSPADAGLALCDVNGAVVFSRRITTNSGSQTDVFYDIIPTSDGGYMAAGAFSPNDNTNWAAFFLKMDSDGNTQWYRAWNNNRTDFVTGIRELPTGGYIASGFGNSYGLGGPHDGIAIRLDQDGDLLWTKAYGTPTDGGFSDVELTDDGGFLFAAGIWQQNTGNFPEGAMVKTYANGKLEWTHLYRPSNNLDWESGTLKRSADGNYLLAGRNRPNFGDTKAYLLKIDPNGQPIWTKQYGGNNLESMVDVFPMSSGKALWTGYTTSSTVGGEDIYLLKTDEDGIAGACEQTLHTTQTIPLQITETSGTLLAILPPPLVNYSLPVSNILLQKSEICTSPCDSVPEICDNNLDDDGDGLFDCLDPDCGCNTCTDKSANIWYFRTFAGLDFNTDPPTVLTNGKTETLEASATISDANGRLLFYTDNQKIYNRKHQVMPNGADIHGSASAAQCIIVPHPGDRALFYVFTPFSPDSVSSYGLSYSLIDMRLDGGFGDVVPGGKNIELLPNDRFSEEITAIYNCEKDGYWVVTYDRKNNAFIAYFVGLNGLEPTPIMSFFDNSGVIGSLNGQMKISPDGSFIVRLETDRVVLGKFNPNNGQVNDTQVLNFPPSSSYGLTFSPSGRYLYNERNISNKSQILQFDLYPPKGKSIFETQVEVASYPDLFHFRAMQLAPNGKIYIAPSGTGSMGSPMLLSQINFPDKKGTACGFQLDAQVGSASNPVGIGLPNFPVHTFWKPQILFNRDSFSDTICPTPAVRTFSLKNLSCRFDSSSWRLLGPIPLIQQYRDSIRVRLDAPGKVIIMAKGYADSCYESTDTLRFVIGQPVVPTLDLGPDKESCDNQATVLQAQPGFARYRWFDGSDEQSTTTTGTPGKYWVDVWDACGNKWSDTIEVKIIPATVLNLGPDMVLCDGDTLSFSLPAPFTSWKWFPSVGLSCSDCPTITASVSDTSYVVSGVAPGGCLSVDTLNLSILEPLDSLTLNLAICKGESAIYNNQNLAPGGPYTFVFSDINGCDSVVVVAVTELDSVLIHVSFSVCPGNSYTYGGQTLSAGGPYPYVFTGSNGCDSTVLVTILEKDTVVANLELMVCPAQTVSYNGQTLPVGGPYSFLSTSINGCDSLTLVTVSEWDTALTNLQFYTCPGVAVIYAGQSLMPGGPYAFGYSTQNGCDSTVLVIVSEWDTALTHLQFYTCPGVAVIYAGQSLLPGGPYAFGYSTQNGCDSTILVTVSEWDTALTNLEFYTCPGEAVIYAGQSLMSGGPYTFGYSTQNGCDSTVLVMISEWDTALTHLQFYTCPGEPVIYGGQSLMSGGPYTFGYSTQNGCDSTILVTVSEWDTALTHLQFYTCPGEAVIYAGQSLMSGGPYTFGYSTQNGCDSTILVMVSEWDTALTNLEFYTCPGEPVIYAGQSLMSGGPYTFGYSTQNGCDSTILVMVSEWDTALTHLEFYTCPGVPVIYEGQSLLPGGPYFFSYATQNGCDSTILVTISQLDTALTNLSLTTCSGDSIVYNNLVLYSGGPYEFDFSGMNGCDSTVLVYVLAADSVLQNVDLYVCPGESVEWDGQTLVSGGPYPFVYSRINSCDSTILVNVLEKDSSYLEVNLEVCPYQKAVWEGQEFAPGGPYFFSLAGENGCDSTIGVKVTALPGVVLQLASLTTVRLGKAVRLLPFIEGNGPFQYNWQPSDYLSCAACIDPMASPVQDQWYTLEVTDSYGCTAIDSIYVHVTADCDIYFPNAIYPGGNEKNSWFYPITASCVREVRLMQVYSRWGELVFERKNFQPNIENLGWNGTFKQKEFPPDVFIWIAELELLNGSIEQFKGDVTIVR